MHKVLPLLILIVLGGMVVYTITQPGANFNPIEFAYDKPLDAPLPKPSASGKPNVTCIATGDSCVTGAVCCNGFCDRSGGNAVCARLDKDVCIQVGKLCRVGGKHCCNGECLSQFLGFGVCPSGWLPI